MNLLDPSLATAIALAVSLVIPVLSALLARCHWPTEVVGVLSLALSSVNGVLTEAFGTRGGFDGRHAIMVALGSFGVAVLTHYGIIRGGSGRLYERLLAAGSRPRMPVSRAR